MVSILAFSTIFLLFYETVLTLWYFDIFFSEILLDAILNRIPAMETAEVRQFVNGPESFTPDGSWILGESAEVKKIIYNIFRFKSLA